MKTLFIIAFFLCSQELFAQNPDSLGIDNNPLSSEYEAKLLNPLLEEPRDTFDFENKKVAFITGSNGGTIV